MLKKLIVIVAFAFAGLGLVSAQNPKTVEATNDKVTICHATSSQSNQYIKASVSKSSVDEPGNKYLNGHGDHKGPVWYQGIANNSWGDIIPPFSYTKKNGQTINYPGYNWTSEGQDWYNNDCSKPGTTPNNYCDPSNRPRGQSIKDWVPNDVRCVEPNVETACGLFNGDVTNFLTGPSWTQDYGLVWSEGAPDYNQFVTPPAQFSEDYNGGSVEVYYWVVGPEADYVTERGIPNYWEQNAASVTIDTDCESEDGTTPTTPLTPTSTDIEEDKDQVEAPASGVNAGSGDAATAAVAAVTLIGSIASVAYGVVRFTKFGA